jgi:transcriptional regulator with XRE-family HTH domain
VVDEPIIDGVWVDAAFKRTGKKGSHLARLLGIDPAAVSRMRAGDRQPKAREIPKIKQFFGVGLEPWEANPTTREVEFVAEEAISGKGDDIPVFAEAEAGVGSRISYEPVSWEARPAPLHGVRGGYAVLVTGESMIPVVRPGTVLFMHPGLPPRPDDITVFFQDFGGDPTATVKEFRGQTDTTWRVRRYNPAPEEITLKKSAWPQCHVSIARYSRR